VTGRIGWVSNADLYASEAAAPTLALTWGTDVAPSLEPDDDDQRVRNDVTVTRAGGGSARVQQDTGPNSVSTVGRYSASVELNVAADSQLVQHAAWRVHVGTWDELRVPSVRVDLVSTRSLIDRTDATGTGSMITLAGAPAWLSVGDLRLLVEGWDEDVAPGRWDVVLRTSPADIYRAFTEGDADRGRVDTMGSTLASGVTSTATSWSVATTTGPRWIDSAAYSSSFPFSAAVVDSLGRVVDVVTVTAISGTTSPQTWTVTRNVLGYTQAHSTGAPVRLYRPGRVVL
jgi:hypothetical protein